MDSSNEDAEDQQQQQVATAKEVAKDQGLEREVDKHQEQVQKELQHLEDLRKEVQEHKSTIAHTNGLINASERKIAAAEEEILVKVRASPDYFSMRCIFFCARSICLIFIPKDSPNYVLHSLCNGQHSQNNL